MWHLVLLPCVISLVYGQQANESGCSYTFTVPLEHFESQCMTHELRGNLEEIRRENKRITDDNIALKEKIEKLSEEYGDMVETVKRLEQETASWRQIVEWPSYDTPFDPENIKDVIDSQTTYEDCFKAIRRGSGKEGMYYLQPTNAPQKFRAYCDKEGWTIISRRLDGKTDFYRDWSDYSGGFGNVGGEYWIGLEKMHMMTNAKKYQFRVEAMGWNQKLYTAEHDYFFVDDELSEYELSIGNMTSGNTEDVMTELNGVKFTTRYRDNDEWQGNCASYYKGGWWLKSCGFDPNRQYCDGSGCMSWGDSRIKGIKLMIRPMAAKDINMGSANARPPKAPKESNAAVKAKKQAKKAKKNKKAKKAKGFF